MARKALVEIATGKVVNVIIASDDWQPPVGHQIRDAQNASPGDIWDGVKFSPPPPTDEQVKSLKRAEAQALALQAIKDNAAAAPWGRILKDLAVGQGWIEP